MRELIKHSIEMRRTQSVATLLTVAISVAVLFALALTTIGVQSGLFRSSERYGADLMVIPADAAASLDESAYLFTGSPVTMYMPASVADEVAAVEGVSTTTVQFYGQTLNASCCSASSPARLIGYDAATDWVISPWTSNRFSGVLGPAQVIIGSDLASDFANGTGSVLGHAVTVAAVLDETGTDLDGSIIMDIDTVRDYASTTLNFADLWITYGQPSELVSTVLVKVDDAYVTDKCGGSRDDALNTVAAALSDIPGVAVIQGSKAVKNAQGNLMSLFKIMAAAALLLVIASLLQLFTRFFTMAWDRRGELALYRALGASRHDVSRLIGGEAAVLIGGGVAAGILLGIALYLLVPRLLASSGSFPFVTPGVLAWIAVIACIVALFALIGLAAVAVPLRRANRIDPSAAMQMGDID